MTDNRRTGSIIPAAELLIGDTVSLQFADRTWDTAVVIDSDHTDDKLTLERPYAVIGDTITTSGLSFSVGIERLTVSRRDSGAKFLLLRKTDAGKHWAAVETERRGFQAEIERLKKLVAGQHDDLNQRADIVFKRDEQITLLNHSVLREREKVTDYAAEIQEHIEARKHAENELVKLQHAIQLLGQSLVQQAHPAPLTPRVKETA